MIDANFLQSSARTSKPPTALRRFSNREADEMWAAAATTCTGLGLTIVPARADDRDALERFFEYVKPEDLYFRFLSGIRKVDDSRIDAMLREDADFSIDFLALDSDTGEILANASLVADANFDSAEVAMCMRADAKNKGIGLVLLDHSANYAAAMGVRQIYSVQGASQTEAVQLEREMGFTVRMSSEDPVHMLVEKTFDQQ